MSGESIGVASELTLKGIVALRLRATTGCFKAHREVVEQDRKGRPTAVSSKI